MKFIAKIFFCITVCLAQLSLADSGSVALPQVEMALSQVARPSVNGKLHVEGTVLKDEKGNEAILRGFSTHGLTWYPKHVNEKLFRQVSTEWNANLIRLAMYSYEYCNGYKEKNLAILKKGIEFAIKADMYVMIDWHILKDNNPNENLTEALAFFNMIAKEYANVPNIIYEICNEPNRDCTWEDIKEYCDMVIPIIRKHNPDAVILVGTPNYDLDIEAPNRDPLSFENVMYSFHFYASSHKANYRELLKRIINDGTPIFITECGLSEASGDGITNFDSVRVWYSLMDTLHLSYAIWSLSNKEESSAIIRNTVSKVDSLKDSDLTAVGLYSKQLLQHRKSPSEIFVKQDIHSKFTLISRTKKHFLWCIFTIPTIFLIIFSLLANFIRKKFLKKGNRTYDELLKRSPTQETKIRKPFQAILGDLALISVTFFSLIYLCWRGFCSIPTAYGTTAIICSSVLLAVEFLGLLESLIHYRSMMGYTFHPLPKIKDSEYPHVDVFVSTYNEPAELLRKTLIGCKNMLYPDKSKVHIYLCDDHRRSFMRDLAEELQVNYFDRPDNEGAKAGNLNAALARTTSPYIVTFDADMIPRREFLMNTIPYFVHAEKINETLCEKDQMHLGLLQTPQYFYNPDVFQHNLYAEKRIPNEQNFFYQDIEAAKTSTNSVIYGGSNTILSRRALNDIGGFYTKSITEDFATGLLIESKGYVSLGLSTPLASGIAPNSFKEHVQQRTRWGRGVIATAKQLKFLRNKGLSFSQKMSYLSSVVYWFSPIKNLIYLMAPLLFAVFCIPIFDCSLLDLAIFWFPMHVAQTLSLRAISTNKMSSRWSGIYETSVMPFLLIPVIKETLGITLSTFKVTQKEKHSFKRHIDKKSLLPFSLLLTLTIIGIIKMAYMSITYKDICFLAGLFWLFRNCYYLIMSIFLCIGRDTDSENVKVQAAENVVIKRKDGGEFNGITTQLLEHSISVYTDELNPLNLGETATISLSTEFYQLQVSGTVVNVTHSCNPYVPCVYTIEILDYQDKKDVYIQMLYDRIPTLPEQIRSEGTSLRNLWINFTKRVSI